MPTVKPKTTTRKLSAVKVRVKRINPDAVIPSYKTEGAACFDLVTMDDIVLSNINVRAEALMVHTGLAFEIPKGYHMKIYLRSSIGLKTKLRLANGTGIIDSDYRGEVMLLVENASRDVVIIPKGTRIAQGIIEKNIPVIFEEVKELSETKRGDGGFGSTGKI